MPLVSRLTKGIELGAQIGSDWRVINTSLLGHLIVLACLQGEPHNVLAPLQQKQRDCQTFLSIPLIHLLNYKVQNLS